MKKGNVGTVILIIFGVILSVIAIGLVTGENRLVGEFTKRSPYVPDSYLPKTNDALSCGLKISEPTEGGSVTLPFIIKGYVNGCGWVPFEEVAGIVEVFDNNNNRIAIQPLLATTDWATLPVYFSASINAPNSTSGGGSLVFKNVNIGGENPLSQTMQISF